MMRTALQITRVNLLQIVRDRRALLIMIVMPLVITLILSFGVGGMFGGQSIPQFHVSVDNEEGGLAADGLVRTLKASTPTIKVDIRHTEAEVKADLNRASSAVGVLIPPSFSASIEGGKSASPIVFGPMNRDTQIQIVKSIVNAYGMKLRTDEVRRAPSDPTASGSISAVLIDLKSTGTRPLNSGSYYSIGMMVMFLLNTAASRANALVNERNGDTYKRLQAAPMSRVALVVGYWMSYCTILFGQGFLLLLGCRFILGIMLGPWAQMIVTLAAYSISLAGLSLFIGSTVKNGQLMDSLGGIGPQILALLGGSIFPLFSFPNVFQAIGKVIPNGIALAAFDNSVTGTSFSSLIGPITYLLMIGLGFGVIAGFRFGRTQG